MLRSCLRLEPPNAAWSLVSRFTPGIVAEVADRINAMVLLGPRETLRRDCSLNRALSIVFEAVDGSLGLLAAAPGFGFASDKRAGCLGVFGFSDGLMTGPPSLRLMESQSSGKRVAKLCMQLGLVRLLGGNFDA